MTNIDVANALLQLADALKLGGAKGPDQFKIRSYQKAAQVLHDYPNDLSKMDAAMLQSIPGIGKSISEKIIEFTTTGKLKKLDDLQKSLPPLGISEFTKLRKVGPVAAKKIWQETGATNIVDLIKLSDAGKLNKDLTDAINFYKATSERILLSKALSITEPIFKLLEALPSVKRIEYVGSISRKKDTIKDADFLVLSREPKEVIRFFTSLADEIIMQGEIKASIYMQGLRVDLTLVVEEIEWGSALMHSVGPASYNIKCRTLAKKKGWQLNDKGLWDQNKRLDDGSEQSICDKLGIIWAPPILRELAVFLWTENEGT